MTGPEHYREAERLLALADARREYLDAQQQTYIATRAHAHATLALAAATAEPIAESLGADPGDIRRAWSAAIS